jgi:hypothetical protein
MRTIDFDKEKLNELKAAYHKAKRENLEQFDFEGQTLLVSYAKYLIEYLDLQFTRQ